MTVEQASAFLRLDVGEIRAAVKAGELPVVHRGRQVLVDTRQLLVELGIDPDSLPVPVRSSRRRHDS
jgi:excisionase family DNA binding protein